MSNKLSAKNAAFWALDKRNRRIAIAKDVIKQISDGKIKATQATYFLVRKTPNKNGRLDTFLKDLNSPCTCCGIGACFYSLVMLGDKVRIENTLAEDEDGITDYRSSIDDSILRKYLKDHFSPEQITLIESAFEGAFMYDPQLRRTKEINDQIDSAMDFRDRLTNNWFEADLTKNEFVLQGIMKNIIKNRGTFRPDKP